MSTLYELVTATASLQDYWPLDDGSGSAPVDTQGSPGAITGTPAWNPSGIPLVGGTGSVEFDGSTYITSASEYSVADTGSIEVWFYPPDPTTLVTPGGLHLLAGFFGGDSDSGDTQIAAGVFASYSPTMDGGHQWNVVLKLPVPSAGQNVETSKAATIHLTEGQWNQVVVTWNPSTANIYVNGADAGSYAATDWFSDTDEFYMGAYSTAGFYVGGGFSGGGATSTIFGLPGVFSNVSTYYGHELTSTEVSDHYAAGSADVATLARVTNVKVEVLDAGDGSQSARVTNLAVEALVSVDHLAVTLTATTSLRIGLAPTEIRDARLTSFADLRITSVGSRHLLPVVTSTTDLRITSLGSDHVLPIVTSTTNIRVGSVGSEAYLPVVTATTAIRVGLKAEDPFFMTASTGLRIGLKASAPNQKNVTATTDIRIGHRPSTSLISTFVYASASTGIRVGHAQSVSVSRSRLVAATTALRIGLSASCRLGVGYIVRAATSLWAGSLGAETRDAAVSATTSLSIAHQATKGREIFVSAITGIFATSDEDDEVAKAAKSTTSLRVGLNASASVGGHDAATGFRIGHMASATRAIPWRPDGLNLQPGGNLPHS